MTTLPKEAPEMDPLCVSFKDRALYKEIVASKNSLSSRLRSLMTPRGASSNKTILAKGYAMMKKVHYSI